MKIITVDFDGTLFKVDSFKLMFQERKKDFRFKDWGIIFTGAAYALLLGMTKGKQALRNHFFNTFAKTFHGMTKKEIDLFFRQLVEEGEVHINHLLVKEIRKHQAVGNQVVLLSGALMPFLEAFTDKLDMNVTVIGTSLGMNRDGVCTGTTSTVINGEEKVAAIMNWLRERELNPEQTEVWAYADSESDIPLLHFVDQPIIVNPKEKMRKVAETNQWPIFGEN